ncbi:AIM24 family protein [Gordonia sp. TBRC 11910]|uniref:AIM24 family protein n=1 Tax=Gordonia asplenii TaxID=2725283 RepID=A0A848KZ84_9ACTN|nr:AIM24 family protein [Gordonia asplenii]NMO03467.1 AIM24 family protein [Gordonia asplenii]
MFTKVNGKVVSVNLAQAGQITARRGAMLFYTGQVWFEPHQIPGGMGGGMGGLGGLAGMAGRMMSGEHEATMIAQGNGTVHYGYRGLDVAVVELGAGGGANQFGPGGEMRVEASRLLAYSQGLQATIVSTTSSGVGVGGGGRGGGLMGALRSAAGSMATGQGMFTTQLTGAGSAVILGHGGFIELPVSPNRPLTVDPQAFAASVGQIQTSLRSTVSLRNMGRTGGEGFQLDCTGQGVVYVQASEHRL